MQMSARGRVTARSQGKYEGKRNGALECLQSQKEYEAREKGLGVGSSRIQTRTKGEFAGRKAPEKPRSAKEGEELHP